MKPFRVHALATHGSGFRRSHSDGSGFRASGFSGFVSDAASRLYSRQAVASISCDDGRSSKRLCWPQHVVTSMRQTSAHLHLPATSHSFESTMQVLSPTIAIDFNGNEIHNSSTPLLFPGPGSLCRNLCKSSRFQTARFCNKTGFPCPKPRIQSKRKLGCGGPKLIRT